MDLFVLKSWLIARFSNNERGANLVEYVLLLTFIALLVIVVVTNLGNKVSTKFSSASSQLG
ncbi:MAG: Flp/Fap pilin component [Actinomycetia bacterium]|jgi:Flp pilus assembly pilin Flp|nr:Flp/Fap pilin component [Actinomycetes bacterium]